MKKLLLVLLLLIASTGWASDIYPPPTTWSFGSLASWAQPLVASGTVLPAVASAADGDIFVLASSPAPIWYRHHLGTWTVFAGSTGGSIVPGGDLSGTVASATVNGIRGRTIADEVPADFETLVWYGATWTASLPIPVHIQASMPETVPAAGVMSVIVDPVASLARLLVVAAGATSTTTATYANAIPDMTANKRTRRAGEHD